MTAFARKARVESTHLYICPIGSSYTASGATEATTVTESAMPTDSGAYTYLGVITEFKSKKASKKEECWGPSEGSGVIILQDVVEYQLDKSYTAKLGQLSAAIVGIMENAGILTGSDTDGGEDYVPNSTTTPNCWIIIQQMDHENSQVNLVKALAFVDADGDMDGAGGLAKGGLSLRLKANSANCGRLGPLPTGKTIYTYVKAA